MKWFKIICDYRTAYERTRDIIRDKKTKVGKVYTMKVTPYGTFRFNFSEISDTKIKYRKKDTLRNTGNLI